MCFDNSVEHVSFLQLLSMYAQIYPSKKETWDIQPFHIVSSGVDSDSDRECIDDQPNEPMSDISKLLREVRKAAEVSTCHERAIQCFMC